MTDDRKAISARVREARKAAKMTQQEVADLIFMSKSNYQKLESADVGIPGERLMELARLFNIPAQSLLPGPAEYTNTTSHAEASELPQQTLEEYSKAHLIDIVKHQGETISNQKKIIQLLEFRAGADEQN
ncbi:MAG: helix-turn-helix transcriptional regulator [Bacteroidota bacterium]